MLPLIVGFALITSCKAEEKPNIILLMIDDCSAVEFSCYATKDHPSAMETPVVDALASEGMLFTTCWATPLCMPTRAMLMSGKYGAHTGVWGNRLSKPDRDFASRHKPIPRVLKEAGYETAISGKWHLPGNAGEEAWGLDEYSLLGGYFRPFDGDITWNGLWFSWSKASHTFYDTAVIGQNRGKYPALYWHGAVVENGELLPSGPDVFAPDQCQAFALDFISRERSGPFFLYYPMVLPHDPFLGAPDPDRPGERTGPGFLSLLERVEYYLDELVGTLKEEGLWENTILVFTGDNATLANGKGSCSELGVRVPLVVAGGPVSARGVSDALVDFTDIYPTIMEMAGLDPEILDGLDGQSFYPALQGKVHAAKKGPGQDYPGKEYIFSYLDLQRTVRNRDYMMDGTGGIWKCSPNGNILDYEPMEEGPETEKIRAELLRIAENYPLPTEKHFRKERLDQSNRPSAEQWPSHHSTTLHAWKKGNAWIDNERRKQK